MYSGLSACLSVGRNCEPYKNGRTDRHAVPDRLKWAKFTMPRCLQAEEFGECPCDLWWSEFFNHLLLLLLYYVGLLSNWHTHPLNDLCPGLPGWACTRKVKPMWILLTEWQWHQLDYMQSAPNARQKTMPAPHHSFFIGCMPFLMPNQQRQSTEN